MRALRCFVAVALVTVACATNPATGRRQLMLMSESEEIALGKQADAEIRQQMGLYQDSAWQQYVNQVGQRLARASHRPNLPWTFAVVDQQAVNAFALPGGYIYLTRGILPFLRDEAELAAVLGHEVGHVDARHSASAYSKQVLAGGGLAVTGILFPETQSLQGLAGLGLGLVFLKHSREAELESDQLGVQYTAQNGWDPTGMPGLLTTLQRLDQASGNTRGVPNWAATHPLPADRVAQVQEAVTAARGARTATRNEEQFEQRLDGLVFGDSREQGFVRGSDFLHPVLRLGVRFPQGWEVMNSPEQVLARRGANSNAVIVLQVAPRSGGSVENSARSTMAEAGFRLIDGDAGRINGLDAFVGVYQGTTQETADTAVQAAHIRLGNTTYVLAGISAANAFNSSRGAFQSTIQSFRPLSAAEAERLQPDRVDFYTARSGDTWESIASRAGGGVRASTLAIMNGSDPATPPRAGSRIRIVVRG
jgi:predicted Zn-dependent protease